MDSELNNENSELNKEIDQNENQKPETVEKDALNLYVGELTKLFRHGVRLGFLVQRGDNYHWIVNGEEHQTEA